ncbi:biotin-dependent carboxyltransferase family protein [Bosea sp. (in: a-proteobacteria)]|uniref:5-oxoprolinase subunit C family protein n=1 Tax=Bosea sp. (in: a-proteobacteria) TaxID=1871050 RepID=UPI00260650E3|nr:biotin-dependent carboxyltransferase family protein [Bosea sp. (in: a-proteobacteria)]MCO5089947.1 biotin-dependent carboxyltransferase family protein [Bosea sp. (in: a-proteobacteria)]
MGALLITACGPAISIQDRGRLGFQRFGVSPAGAIDPLSLAVANVLVGNPADSAAVELGVGVTRFVAEGSLLIALAGPDCQLEVEGRRIPQLSSVEVRDGETVIARAGARAVYAYLAVRGGVAGPREMGSRSQHRRSAIGGPALGPGSAVRGGDDTDGTPKRLIGNPFDDPGPIRILAGPQDDYFDPSMIARLCRGDYRIGALRDRMGLQLDGPPLQHRHGYNIVSDGIVEGAIQVPGNGRPIVLLRDRQTTGGYPKIATIISADIGRFAQLPSGTAVRLRLVTLDEAIEAARAMKSLIDGLDGKLAPLEAGLSSELLLSLNLIDGVTSAEAPAS